LNEARNRAALIPILNQSAIFVGSVVGFLNVLKYTPPAPPPCRLDIISDLEMVLIIGAARDITMG
jgi:hypothetical protein